MVARFEVLRHAPTPFRCRLEQRQQALRAFKFLQLSIYYLAPDKALAVDSGDPAKAAFKHSRGCSCHFRFMFSFLYLILVCKYKSAFAFAVPTSGSCFLSFIFHSCVKTTRLPRLQLPLQKRFMFLFLYFLFVLRCKLADWLGMLLCCLCVKKSERLGVRVSTTLLLTGACFCLLKWRPRVAP